MNVVVDTSIWIEFFAGATRAAGLSERLEAGEVLLHPWVLGEIALGHLGRKRDTVLRDLRSLPVAPVVKDEDVLTLIEQRTVYGRGIGWVDAQLVASARLSGADLWTNDGRLALAWRWLR